MRIMEGEDDGKDKYFRMGYYHDLKNRINTYHNCCKESEYLLCNVEGISYIGSSEDTTIMRSMFFSENNWAKEEILHFFKLSEKFYGSQLSQLKHPLIFCDIGANIGTTSVYVKKKIDPSLHILAFEPIPLTYEMLQINMVLNHIPKSDYILADVGVSDHESEMNMHYNRENPGGSSLVNEYGEGQNMMVKTTAFDHFIESRGIDRDSIGYLWIDIEGHGSYIAFVSKFCFASVRRSYLSDRSLG